MATDIKKYPDEVLAEQPIGYWSGETYRRVVGRIRADLATEGLTQPHWWILNHVAGNPRNGTARASSTDSHGSTISTSISTAFSTTYSTAAG
ncbi:hypothetical protein [Frankia sp. AgKG'84/4]|uniref:hypothetical protein n=1 Tax=Frankia sp. AgKG'84/4 TaxID=573490 RepID=UPI00200C1379|nr:hypothetical protein [Frankia sp. AgKG'84/4]MCL9792754.1 hypothetical protein [Frankia sp. AgKG'84/4]